MSAFSEAINSVLLADLDPMNAIAKQMATGLIATRDVELDRSKRDFIRELSDDVRKLRDESGDPRIIEAYQRLIVKHSS
jgi:hypothetical protein